MKKMFLTMLVACAALVACQQNATTEAAAEGEAAATEAVVESDLAYVNVDYVLAES